jgi:hypothetical protein
MESDDIREDAHAFATMLRALDDHADWDAVACGCVTAAPAEMPCAMGPSRAGQG